MLRGLLVFLWLWPAIAVAQDGWSKYQIPLQKGSLVYLFTDGYADQFGGDRDKKYKYKTLKAFLLSIQHNEVHLQVEALRQNFYAWRRGLDQVDDVTIAVMRVLWITTALLSTLIFIFACCRRPTS